MAVISQVAHPGLIEAAAGMVKSRVGSPVQKERAALSVHIKFGYDSWSQTVPLQFPYGVPFVSILGF